MKQRFSSIDIKVIAHELSLTLPTLRVSNIYDLSSRIFLFKFAKPNHREQLVLDTGFRCHLTSFARTTAGEPSAFISRLRKFLKTRRVTAVSQVGTDRILEIQFSDGQYRLFLEFYASGNLVLTDKDLKVLALFRIVNEGADHENIRPGSTYNLSERQNINGVPALTEDRIREGLRGYIEKQATSTGNAQWNKKSKKSSGDSLRKALASCTHEFPPVLIEHALRIKNFDVQTSPEDVLEDTAKLAVVLDSLREAAQIMESVLQPEHVKGYIIGKIKHDTQNPSSETGAADTETSSVTGQRSNVLYNDFHPFKPKQFEDEPNTQIVEFDGYNKTVDEFFSSIEGQKLESRLQEKEDAAKRKYENAKQVQESRIEGLQATQLLNVRKAQAIEANLERVTEATAAINGLIAKGMDWGNIDGLIELEQKRHNPVAELIKLPLKLNENTATLLLSEWDSHLEEDEGDLTESEPSFSDDEAQADENETDGKKPGAKVSDKLSIDIDLALSAWSNAREYYDNKKVAAAKQEKTVQASHKALKNAKQKIDADLKRSLKQETQTLRPLRSQMWFEKFIFFISSDGYLVLGGNDDMQSDLLYKRHFRPGDVFVHADIGGAAPIYIKNNSKSPDSPIPPSTLSQAGNLSVITSTAWDSKAVMSAWWVTSDQVSKTAPTGDYLSPGNFHIKGDKNYLPPAHLLLGFAVVFQISETSKANHTRHRVHASSIDQTEASEGAERAETGANKNVEAISGLQDDQASLGEEEDEDGEGDNESAFGTETYEGDSYQANAHNPLQPDVDEGDELKNEYDENASVSSVDRKDTATEISNNDDEATAYNTLDNAPQDNGDSDETDDNTEALSNQDAHVHEQKAASQTSKQTLPMRGKRGKRKKKLQKYADQDEEDREAAMRLLGSRTGQEKAEREAQAKKDRQEELEAQKQRRREQHIKREKEGKALEEKRQAHMEAGIEATDGELADVEHSVDLDTLVGKPLPEDEILDAIPVCAPWNALSRYKYKAKMQPGYEKKGKAVRSILGKWSADSKDKEKFDEKSQDVERIWPREIELITNWKEAEVLNFLPVSKVKVMMSGASGAGKDNKAGAQGKGRGKGKGGKGSKK